MNQEDTHRLLKLAERAAARAAAALLESRAQWRAVEAEEGREVKLKADRAAEALIVETLQRDTPYRVLSEEAGWIAGDAGDLFWAVDPLDGSVNYAQSFPHWAVSIALVQVDGATITPVLGVVDCPVLGEVYAGVPGHGATLNGAPISVSGVEDPARGVLMTGIPARAATDRAAMDALMARLLRWRKVRMIGSAACALSCVAGGRADAYQETGGMLWDVAGGCALVAGAGGFVSIEAPDGADKPLIVSASNGRVPRESIA